MIKEIENLPTYVNKDEVQKWFINVMTAYERKTIDKNELMDCFLELADQQYHQYELMDESLCLQIESWSFNVFNIDNIIEAKTFVPLAHSLAFSTDSVKKLLSMVQFEELKNEFVEMLSYTAKDRINPYWDLNSTAINSER